MAINDGSTVPLTGFAGTVSGVLQNTVEETNGARKIERVPNESAETAAVVVTGKHKDLTLAATVLSTFAATYRMSSVIAYNGVNYRATAVSRSRTPTLNRLNLSLRKEANMTYTLPA
jgi:hypothetical protein